MTGSADRPASGVSSKGSLVGRYALHEPIASGGMAVVHLGRLHGPVGFGRTVAIKRVHPNLVHDPDFVVMFVDEARLAARIHHPNVVPTLDVVVEAGEILLVMEYVHGESLAVLLKCAQKAAMPVPAAVCSAVLVGLLHGLHAAHEARDEQGEPLGIVHRDVSPQNVLVGADGVARVLDFGVAKAAGRLQTTREGSLKGKLSYMAPEQLLRKPLSRRTDVYAAAVVGWELATGKRLFLSESEGATVQRVLSGDFVPPSQVAPGVPPALDAILLRGLSQDPASRFETAREMALALEAQVPPALPSEVAKFVEDLAGDRLRKRAAAVAAMESVAPRDKAELSVSLGDMIPPGPTHPSTQSQLSVFSDTPPPGKRSRRRARAVAGAAAAALVAAVGAVVVFHEGRSSAPPSTDVAPTASGVVPASGASSDPPAPSALPPVAAMPAVAASAPTPALAPARTAPPARVPVPSRAPPRAGCNPPYTIDGIGRRIYKRECF